MTGLDMPRDATLEKVNGLEGMICRLWPEFENAGVSEEYCQGVHRILTGYGVVWKLTEKGRL
jgi:hypothetical protein